MHFNKAVGQRAIYRVNSSIAYVASAVTGHGLSRRISQRRGAGV
jgi:hypothetical protein